MRIGKLDRRVTIQSLTETQDSAGQPIKAYADLATIWAERRDVRGNERFASNQALAMRAAIFRIRWRTGMTEKMRLIDDGTTYDVTGIAGDRRKGWMELSCEAFNPAAPGAG